jgi:hypothetical protein
MHEVRINNLQVNSEAMLNYDHKFSDDLHLHALVGQNVFYKKYDALDITGTSFTLPDLFDITNTKTQTMWHYSYQRQTLGVYGDVQLSWKELLFLEGTLRRDWSSTLPRNNMGFTYPSVSAGFVFSDLTHLDWLSYGKLRGSIAGTANDADPYYTTTPYTSVTPSVLTYPRYSYSTQLGNPYLKPEHTTQREIGVDLGVLKQKIFLEATYYAKTSRNLILTAPTSNATGVTTQIVNLGEVSNKGVDATLTFKDIVKAKGFSWTSAFNFSRNVSKVIKVGDNGNDRVILQPGYNATAEIDAQKGQPFGAIYGYAWKRYDADPNNSSHVMDPGNPNYTKAPMFIENDGTVSSSGAKVLLGNTSPKFIGAWNNTLKYHGFTLGWTLEWRHGGDVLNDFNRLLTYSGKGALTQNRYYASDPNVHSTMTYTGVDVTGKAKTSNPIQLSKSWYATGLYIQIDEHWVEDASWLRLRNVYLAYSIPENLLKPLHIKGAEVTIAGRNVWLHTKYTGIDPEVASTGNGPNGVTGIDYNGVPATKAWDASIRINF